MPSSSTLGVGLGLFLLLVGRSALAQRVEFCSSINTGANYSTPLTDTFQSTGLCVKQCEQNYALAVLQGDTCWCSDYAPASTTDTGDCDETCPGFAFDSCGSTAKDLYTYIAIAIINSLSGTNGAVENATSAAITTITKTATITICGDESSTVPTTFETLT